MKRFAIRITFPNRITYLFSDKEYVALNLARHYSEEGYNTIVTDGENGGKIIFKTA